LAAVALFSKKRIPSGDTVSTQEFVKRLQQDLAAGKPCDWVELQNEIQEESGKATSPQKHDALRGIYFAVMNDVEKTPNAIRPDHWRAFKEARRQSFNLLIARECIVDEQGNVSADDLYRVTRAAGRMPLPRRT
jgi:hypothetical protein